MSVIAAVLGVALLLAAGVYMSADPSRGLTADSIEYLGLARNLASGAGFTSIYTEGAPELYRTPGYPLLLAATGAWWSRAGLASVVAVQILLALAAALALGAVVRPFGPTASWGVAALYLTNPVLLAGSASVLSEALFVPLIVFSLALAFRATSDARRSSPPVSRRQAAVSPGESGGRTAAASALVSGFLAGFAVLVRPVGGVLIPLVVLCGLPQPRFRRLLVLWAAAALVLPLGWACANGVRHGFWGVSKTGTSYLSSAYGSRSPGVDDRVARRSTYDREGAGVALADIAANLRERPEVVGRRAAVGAARVLLGPGEYMLRQFFLDEASCRPGFEATVYTVRRTPGGLQFDPSPTDPVSRGATAAALVAWSWTSLGLTYALAAIGVVVAVRRRRRTEWIWIVAAVLLVAASAGQQANARFRLPVLPFVLLLAGPGIAQLASLSWFRSRAGHEPVKTARGTIRMR